MKSQAVYILSDGVEVHRSRNRKKPEKQFTKKQIRAAIFAAAEEYPVVGGMNYDDFADKVIKKL